MRPGGERVQPRWAEGWGDAGAGPGGESGRAYRVIVHAAGQLDDDETAGYWTEVPALAACASDGQTLEEAIASTISAIKAWLAGRSGGVAVDEAQVQVQVDLAY